MDLVDEEKRTEQPINPREMERRSFDVTRVTQLEAELNDLRAGTSNMQLAYQDAIMLAESKVWPRTRVIHLFQVCPPNCRKSDDILHIYHQVKENERLAKELENLKQERTPKMSQTRDALAFIPSFSSIVDAGMVAFAPPEKRKQPAVLATQLLRSQELEVKLL